MRYISDDGKVFNTEQECLEHEQKIEQERVEREKWKAEKQSKLEEIYSKELEIQTLIREFEKKYCKKAKVHFKTPADLVKLLETD